MPSLLIIYPIRGQIAWHSFFSLYVITIVHFKMSIMEIKRNDATLNRPDGDRVLDGNYVFVDIPSYVRQLKEEKAWEKNDRNGITVFKSDHITMVITALQRDAEIVNNSVDGFLTLQLLKASGKLTTPDGEIDITEHQMMTFHPKIPHSLQASSDVILLITTFNFKFNENTRSVDHAI